MGQNLMIVKVTFDYFIELFKKGESKPYHSYEETFSVKKAVGKEIHYEEVLKECRKSIESDLVRESTDKNDDGKEFKCLYQYDIPKLVSYQILAEED
jgi:hypothetical protein